MKFDYWLIVPLVSIGLTVPIWVYLWRTRRRNKP